MRGLVINDFPGDGILIESGGSNTIQCNHVGTNVAGSAAEPNGTGTLSALPAPDDFRDLNGITLYLSNGNLIGGDSPGQGNLLSGNGGMFVTGSGVRLVQSDDNRIQGNLIGTDATGGAALPNLSSGAEIERRSDRNLLGGTTAGARNVISGNDDVGVEIDEDSNDNIMQGNFVGLNAAGTAAVGNREDGIEIDDRAARTLIGGPAPAARNLVAGNRRNGLRIDDDATFTRVEGNFVGLNAAGTSAVPNLSDGIEVDDGASDTLLLNNVVSGNGDGNPTHSGIEVDDGALRTTLRGNIVGLDPDGTFPIPNLGPGVRTDFSALDTVIGGTEPGDRNIISANGDPGIIVGGSAVNMRVTIRGNFIGTGADPFSSFPNGFGGIIVDDFISGTSEVSIIGNVVANHPVLGILLADGNITNNFDNCIFNNGLGMDNLSGVTTLASGNYWGAPDGPAPIGAGNGIGPDISLGNPADFRTTTGSYCLNHQARTIPAFAPWGAALLAGLLALLGAAAARRKASRGG